MGAEDGTETGPQHVQGPGAVGPESGRCGRQQEGRGRTSQDPRDQAREGVFSPSPVLPWGPPVALGGLVSVDGVLWQVGRGLSWEQGVWSVSERMGTSRRRPRLACLSWDSAQRGVWEARPLSPELHGQRRSIFTGTAPGSPDVCRPGQVWEKGGLPQVGRAGVGVPSVSREPLGLAPRGTLGTFPGLAPACMEQPEPHPRCWLHDHSGGRVPAATGRCSGHAPWARSLLASSDLRSRACGQPEAPAGPVPAPVSTAGTPQRGDAGHPQPVSAPKEGCPHQHPAPSAPRWRPWAWCCSLARWPGEASSWRPPGGWRCGGWRGWPCCGGRRGRQTRREARGLCSGGGALAQLTECQTGRPGLDVFLARGRSREVAEPLGSTAGPGRGSHCATVSPGGLSCAACPSQ